MPGIRLQYCHRQAKCQFCYEPVTLSQRMVKVWFVRGRNPASFHLQCWYEKMGVWFDQHPYVPPKRRRRKCPPELQKQYKQVYNKILYHRKKGHEDRVRLLEEELEALKW